MKLETVLSNFEKEGIELYIGKPKEVTTKGVIKNGEVVWDKELEPGSDDWQPFSHKVNYVYIKKGERCAPLSSIGVFNSWKRWSSLRHRDLISIHFGVSDLGVAPESVVPFVELERTLVEGYGDGQIEEEQFNEIMNEED